MEEKLVVVAIKKHLTTRGWMVLDYVVHGRFADGNFFPDIVARKGSNIISVECKGSIPLEELLKGVGQCLEHQYYGSTIVCLGVPEDTADEALMLIKHLSVSGGKIGLFVVKPDNKVELRNKWQKIKPLVKSRNAENTGALGAISNMPNFITDPLRDIYILSRISKGVNYPYAIIKNARTNPNAFISKTPKTYFYNVLRTAEKHKFLKSERKLVGRKQQKTYVLTGRGKKALMYSAKQYQKSLLWLGNYLKSGP